MKYLLLICSDGVATPEKVSTMPQVMPGWVQEMDARGVRLAGHALKDADTAVTVRVRGGETLVSDGPFVESKEFVAGFDVIDCENLDEAIEIAAKHPVSWFHCIEIRPFVEIDGMDDIGEAGEIPTTQQLGTPAAGAQRFLLMMCVNGIAEPDDEEAAVLRDSVAWGRELGDRGVMRAGHPLGHQDTATTVRVRDGETLISDGPFAETKEFLGGFAILDCAGQDEAVTLAAGHPLARYHRVEVRPFADDPLGDER
jgi:hypothetical protein